MDARATGVSMKIAIAAMFILALLLFIAGLLIEFFGL